MKKTLLTGLTASLLMGNVAFADISVTAENNNKQGFGVGIEFNKITSDNVVIDLGLKAKESGQSEIKIGTGYITEYGTIKTGLNFDNIANDLYIGYEKDYKDFIFGVEYSINYSKSDFYDNTLKLKVDYKINKEISVYSIAQRKNYSLDLPFGNGEIKAHENEFIMGVKYTF